MFASGIVVSPAIRPFPAIDIAHCLARSLRAASGEDRPAIAGRQDLGDPCTVGIHRLKKGRSFGRPVELNVDSIDSCTVPPRNAVERSGPRESAGLANKVSNIKNRFG